MTKTCKCGREFTTDKYHPFRKQCDECRKKKKNKAYKNWYKKNGKEYMKNYMKEYRFLSTIIVLYLLLPAVANAELSGNIGFRGTFQKPPKYELHIKANENSYYALNRFAIRKKGWMPKEERQEEDDEYLNPFAQQSEPKEAGSWAIEYGAASTQSDLSLIEQDSIYGWKVSLGQVSEFAWGKNMENNRTAMASFSTDKFTFTAYKSFGIKEQDNEYQFLTDAPNANNPNLPKFTAIPITKGEGGAIKLPFAWRQMTGDIEIAGRKRYDDMLDSYDNGIAFLTNINTPRFSLSVRNVGKGYESQIRTTDISIRCPIYRTETTTLSTGLKVIDFSGTTDSRYNAIININRKVTQTKDFSLNISADAGANIQGQKYGLTASGNASLSAFGTTLTLRRSESITGESFTTTNNVSISRKEGSIGLTYNTSEYRNNTATNTTANINLAPFRDFRLGIGIGYNTRDTLQKTTTMYNSNYTLSYRNLRFNSVISAKNQSYNITRDFNIDKYNIKNISLGMSYQRFVKGEGLTGNLSFSW